MGKSVAELDFARIANGSIGGKVRARRLDAGLTQKQLGDRVGLSQEEISRIEDGIVDLSVPLLMKLGDIFGCEPAMFFNGSGFIDLSKPKQYIDSVLNPAEIGLKEGQYVYQLTGDSPSIRALTKDGLRRIVTTLGKKKESSPNVASLECLHEIHDARLLERDNKSPKLYNFMFLSRFQALLLRERIFDEWTPEHLCVCLKKLHSLAMRRNIFLTLIDDIAKDTVISTRENLVEKYETLAVIGDNLTIAQYKPDYRVYCSKQLIPVVARHLNELHKHIWPPSESIESASVTSLEKYCAIGEKLFNDMSIAGSDPDSRKAWRQNAIQKMMEYGIPCDSSYSAA